MKIYEIVKLQSNGVDVETSSGFVHAMNKQHALELAKEKFNIVPMSSGGQYEAMEISIDDLIQIVDLYSVLSPGELGEV